MGRKAWMNQPATDVKQRKCLKCLKQFQSYDCANRICKHCKENEPAVDWKGGASLSGLLLKTSQVKSRPQ